MKIIKITIYLAVLIGLVTGLYQGYKNYFTQPEPKPYTTEKPEKRTLKHVVNTSGLLEMRDILKLGSIQPGVIGEVYVTENAQVKKGQLLAKIDTAIEDTDVKAQAGRVKKAQAEAEYQKSYYHRQEKLYQSGQLALDAFQKIKKDYEKAVADVATEQALLAKVTMQYESTFIRAPGDGVITVANASKGMVANDITNTILFEIAGNTSEMKAVLSIDESEIGQVTVDLPVTISVNTYPDRIFKSKVSEVSFATKANGNGKDSDANSFYKATVYVSNKEHMLRPGMVVNARIKIAKAENCLSVNGLAFQINPDILKTIAEKLHAGFAPIKPEEQKALRDARANERLRFIWVVETQTGGTQTHEKFVQKAISVGITDDTHWEVKSGLTESDNVIIDNVEPDQMEEVYKKWFKGAL
jgi:HlyD family secretion protein